MVEKYFEAKSFLFFLELKITIVFVAVIGIIVITVLTGRVMAKWWERRQERLMKKYFEEDDDDEKEDA